MNIKTEEHITPEEYADLNQQVEQDSFEWDSQLNGSLDVSGEDSDTETNSSVQDVSMEDALDEDYVPYEDEPMDDVSMEWSSEDEQYHPRKKRKLAKSSSEENEVIDLTKEIDDIINVSDPEIEDLTKTSDSIPRPKVPEAMEYIDLTKDFHQVPCIIPDDKRENDAMLARLVANDAILEENKENVPPFFYPKLSNWIFNPPRKQSKLTEFFPKKKDM